MNINKIHDKTYTRATTLIMLNNLSELQIGRKILKENPNISIRQYRTELKHRKKIMQLIENAEKQNNMFHVKCYKQMQELEIKLQNVCSTINRLTSEKQIIKDKLEKIKNTLRKGV